MNRHLISRSAVAALLLAASYSAGAASVYLAPPVSSPNLSAGTVTLELYMDFTSEPTIGGGVDFDFNNVVGFGGFLPTSFFNSLDPDFTGYGTEDADDDFEVHFGEFAGVSGVNKLGDITVNLLSTGAGQINVSINSLYGEFYPVTGTTPITVALNGAQVNVVPLPATALLWLTAFGAAATRLHRRGK
jgi:hypothetical protein